VQAYHRENSNTHNSNRGFYQPSRRNTKKQARVATVTIVRRKTIIRDANDADTGHAPGFVLHLPNKRNLNTQTPVH
jgi:hypothetical protein